MSAVDLQNGVYNKLAADAPLNALVVGIYDNPTQVADPSDNTQFPFITVSDSIEREWDTDTEEGHTADLQIHIWSRAHHAIEAKQIADAVVNVLHRGTITIENHVLIGCDYMSRTVLRDPDGITRHGIVEFRIVYEEA